MYKLWVVLFLFFAVSANAQQNQDKAEVEEVDLLAPAEAVEMPITSVQPEITLPRCQDEHLLTQVQNLIEEHNNVYPVVTIYEKRKRALQLKNTKLFEEEQVRGFSARQNRYVADKLLMTKINEGLEDNEIRLCRSVVINKQFPPIYLMIYKDKTDNIQVFVLNYMKDNTDDLKMVLEN